jgi:hypothetical protein
MPTKFQTDAAEASELVPLREICIAVSHVHDNLMNALKDEPTDTVRCPQCGTPTVLVEGRWIRPFTEEFEDGKSLGEQLSATITKDVTSLCCPVCRVQFRILPDNILDQKLENINLKERLKEIEEGAPKKDIILQ